MRDLTLWFRRTVEPVSCRHAPLRRRFALAATAWALAVVVTVAQDVPNEARTSFRRGYQHIDRGNFADAERELRSAIALQPLESTERVVISGNNLRPYLPHFYLGVALLQQKKFQEAAAEFTISQTQKRIESQREERNQLASYLSNPSIRTANEQLAHAKSTPTPTRPADTVVAGGTTPGTPPVAPEPRPPDARVEPTRPDTTPPPADPRPRDPVKTPDTTTPAQPPSRIEQPVRTTPPATPGSTPRETPGKPPQSTPSGGTVTTPPVSPTPNTPPPNAPQHAPPNSPTSPSPTATGSGSAPAWLRTAAQLYFSGKYAAAVSQLAGDTSVSPRVGAQRELLRAAALYSQFLSGAERETQLEASARAAVQTCVRMDASVKPAPQLFSPRFVDFFSKAASR
ncbi:MAG: hypothetical protein U0Q12_04485 [Vicinamibacterales bacterium]